MSAKKTVRGKRYSGAEKVEIVNFVQQHDAENGRGGKSAAVKKYGVTALTLSAWLSKTALAPKGKRRGKGKVGRSKTARRSGTGRGSSIVAMAERLLAVAQEIEAQEANLEILHKRFVDLRNSINVPAKVGKVG